MRTPKCKCGADIEQPRIVREEHRKTIVIRKHYCATCGLFLGKWKFTNGRETAYCMVQNGNNWTPIDISLEVKRNG